MITMILLFAILILVLLLPFLVKKVEENLEIFLFTMGVLAVTVTAQISINFADWADPA